MATTLASQSLRIAQGEDRVIAITVLDDAAAVSMASAAQDQVVCSLTVNDKVVKTFRRDSPSGTEGTLGTSGAGNNIVGITIARADSATFGEGILKAHIVAKAVTSGIHTEYTITLGSIVKGVMKDASTTG